MSQPKRQPNISGAASPVDATEQNREPHARPDTRSDGITFSVSSPVLSELLARARTLLAAHAHPHQTQRGQTLSANSVMLTWLAPRELGASELPWTREEADWYLSVFVHRAPSTDPLSPVAPGSLLFPYTYAARARYWDAGWSYLYALVCSIRDHGFSLARACETYDYFLRFFTTLAGSIHLQTVLGLLALYPPHVLKTFLANPELALDYARSWRRDILADAIDDLRDNPHSRRAVVSAFSYPHLEGSLQPQMGKPPYQMFQLLPDDEDMPLSSVHEHRSLDIVGGAQLDLLHDLAWLTEASDTLHRPIGDISVFAHNLHEYRDQPGASPDTPRHDTAYPRIEAWLRHVTDGYRTDEDAPAALIKQPSYAANIRRIYALWSAAAQ